MSQNQRNGQGFTLIEMLVVIGVIAVLLSIVVPAISDTTNRAACAANAANLRSIQAEVTLAYQNQDNSNYRFTVDSDGMIVTSVEGLPVSRKTTSPYCPAGTEMKIDVVPNPYSFVAKFGDLTLEDFTAGARGEYVAPNKRP